MCVGLFCLQGFVSIASIELLLSRLYLSFYSHMAFVVLFCAMVWGKRSSLHSSSLFLSRKVAARLSRVRVLPSLIARLNSENVASEKKQLEALG